MFFLISSIGFVFLWILTGVFLVYLIKAMKTFSRIIEKAESSIGDLSDTTKEMLEDVHQSTIFQFIFGKKSKHKSKKN